MKAGVEMHAARYQALLAFQHLGLDGLIESRIPFNAFKLKSLKVHPHHTH